MNYQSTTNYYRFWYLAAVLFLSGCAVPNPANGIRTTEYGAGVQGGQFVVQGDGVVGGCQTAVWGLLPAGTVYTYTGKTCVVRFAAP